MDGEDAAANNVSAYRDATESLQDSSGLRLRIDRRPNDTDEALVAVEGVDWNEREDCNRDVERRQEKCREPQRHSDRESHARKDWHGERQRGRGACQRHSHLIAATAIRALEVGCRPEREQRDLDRPDTRQLPGCPSMPHFVNQQGDGAAECADHSGKRHRGRSRVPAVKRKESAKEHGRHRAASRKGDRHRTAKQHRQAESMTAVTWLERIHV